MTTLTISSTVLLILIIFIVVMIVYRHLLIRRAIDNLKSRYPIKRWKAATRLGRLRALNAAPILVESTKDNDPYVRKCAVKALGMLKQRDSVPEILKLLHDGNWLVKEASIEALGNIGDNSAMIKMELYAKDRLPALREAAEIAKIKLRYGKNILGNAIFTTRRIGIPFIGLSVIIFAPIQKRRVKIKK